MEEPITPEEDLAKELHKQEREIHGNLFHINQLYVHCCDASLSMDEIEQNCKPILAKLRKSNAIVADEIQELLSKKDRQKLLDYFETEKQSLIQVLQDETKGQYAIEKLLNDIRNDMHPTDS